MNHNPHSESELSVMVNIKRSRKKTSRSARKANLGCIVEYDKMVEIRQWCDNHGISVSDAIRDFVERGTGIVLNRGIRDYVYSINSDNSNNDNHPSHKLAEIRRQFLKNNQHRIKPAYLVRSGIASEEELRNLANEN